MDDRITSAGLPHSGIHESKSACDSSWLFAAFRALRRPNTPRHPPYALGSFTFTVVSFKLLAFSFERNPLKLTAYTLKLES